MGAFVSSNTQRKSVAQLKVFLSDSFDPYLNLATEEWIFHNLEPTSQVLFLWRNEPTVVIGRNQNPWAECNLSYMKEDGVHLARRASGGGAVFHDLGNTNFTFLSPKDGYSRENNVQIILRALKEFGIQGEASGRNDLMMKGPEGPRKFSGSAYREKRDRAFHHGTLLLRTDLARLGQYLTPNPKKLLAKGKESVRAQVTNLSEAAPQLTHDTLVEVIVRSFGSFYKAPIGIQRLSMASLQTIPELKAQHEVLTSFDWLYATTMEFTQKMDEYLSLGFFEFNFQVQQAVIRDLQIFSDCLYPQLIEDLTVLLRGQSFTSDSIRSVGRQLMDRHSDLSAGIQEIQAWLCAQIEA